MILGLVEAMYLGTLLLGVRILTDVTDSTVF